MNSIFNKDVESLFIISSPLQVLCAIEAIYEFELSNYKILYAFSSNDPRREQVVSMLKNYKVNYIPIEYKINGVWNYLFSINTGEHDISKKFGRIFIGDIYSENLIAIAYKYSRIGTKLVFMDDGNSTISVLTQGEHIPLSKRSIIRNLLALKYLFKLVVVGKYFFTTYADCVVTKKVVYKNTFSHLLGSHSIEENHKQLYFIGTFGDAYVSEIHISIGEYYNILNKTLKQLRILNPEVECYYIPHGRDKSQETKQIAIKNGFKYLKLNEAVESYLLTNKIYPYLVTGFSSSALFNLQLIYKKTKVINYYVLNEKEPSKGYQQISDLYSKCGIKSIRVL